MGLAVAAAPGVSPLGQKDAEACSPYEILVSSVVEGSKADLGWLAWQDSSGAIVVPGDRRSPLHPDDISEFPEPPGSPLAAGRMPDSEPWSRWYRARGMQSCLVVPVLARGRIVGSMGLASAAVGVLDDDDLHRLELVASLAVNARRYEARLTGLRGLFDEVSRTLENALALDRALRLPPTYRDIARSVGESLDATYCRIAIRDSGAGVTMRAAGGHRPPMRPVGVTWPLASLPRCARALRDRRAVVVSFSNYDPTGEPERVALFSPTTRTGVILPFFVGPRTQGVLIIGEERRARCQPLSPERVAILELVASRIAHIMRMSRRLEYERLAERRRQRRLTIERQHLAREVHDKVGQALSGLLVHVRYALSSGHTGTDELKVMEQAATEAVNGARSLAYGLRNLERGIGPLEGARSFAETLLRAARCTLIWTEQRAEVTVPTRVLREVGRVIKESVSNVVRHAQANTVRIRVEYPDGRIRIVIHDNGVGFVTDDVRPTQDGRGLGLVGCSERLAKVGGHFKVTSTPGKGSTVVIDAPRN